MTTEAAPPRRPRWGRWLIGVGLALYGGLVWHFGAQTLAAELTAARPLPLLGMVALLLAGFALRAWKWRHALGPDRQAVALFFVSRLAGAWSPGRLGELAPLLLPRHRNARVATWILADRLLEAGLTILLGLLALGMLGALSPAWQAVLWAVVLAGAAAGGIWLLRLPPPQVRELADAQGNGWRNRARALGALLRHEVYRLRGKAWPIVTLTLAAKLTDLYAVVLLCAAFSHAVGFWVVCAARCAHALVAMLPLTPDATGVPFVAAAWWLHEYGGIPYPTLTVALGMEVAIINVMLWALTGVAALGLRPRPPEEVT